MIVLTVINTGSAKQHVPFVMRKKQLVGCFIENFSVIGLGVTTVGMILIIRKLTGNSLTLIDKNVTMLI